MLEKVFFTVFATIQKLGPKNPHMATIFTRIRNRYFKSLKCTHFASHVHLDGYLQSITNLLIFQPRKSSSHTKNGFCVLLL